MFALGTVLPASGKPVATSAVVPCSIWLGSVTPAGGHRSLGIHATARISVVNDVITAPYKPGQIRLSARQSRLSNAGGSMTSSGYVVAADSLYWSSYVSDANGKLIGTPELRRVGGGWSPFRSLEVSVYQAPYPSTLHRETAYALRDDGRLYRWTISNGAWRAAGSYAGFAAVKSMTLIAKTPTYETFLANTRGGALYTIRMPVSASSKPVVTPVRTRTWQGFETLSAAACGKNGTLLLGIDKDTKSAYLYAVGHANGLSTVIQSRGKVPATFDDPVYFRWVQTHPEYDVANGD